MVALLKLPVAVKQPAGPPVDRGKQGTKRSLMVDGYGIPIGCVVAGANRNDSPLLAPTLDTLGRFGGSLPDQITVHLYAGYDSKKTLSLLSERGYSWVISAKGEPLQAGPQWVVERTNSWHNRGFKKLSVCTERCTRVVDAFIALANAVIILRRFIKQAWSGYRWDTRPDRRP